MPDILKPPREHKWSFPVSIFRDKTPSHCEETERKCELCGMVKITVHIPRGIPERAWRTKGGTRFYELETPLCDGK